MKWLVILVSLFVVWSCTGVLGHITETEKAQYTQEELDFFNRQQIPGTNNRCCSTADGTYAEEEYRPDGLYTRYVARVYREDGNYEDIPSGWQKVPPETIVKEKLGRPVVWWWFKDGKPEIRCYAPGGGY